MKNVKSEFSFFSPFNTNVVIWGARRNSSNSQCLVISTVYERCEWQMVIYVGRFFIESWKKFGWLCVATKIIFYGKSMVVAAGNWMSLRDFLFHNSNNWNGMVIQSSICVNIKMMNTCNFVGNRILSYIIFCLFMLIMIHTPRFFSLRIHLRLFASLLFFCFSFLLLFNASLHLNVFGSSIPHF